MSLEFCKVVGILGGMGPEATLDLCDQIIKLTPAEKDQDHIPILIYNNPRIPDRTSNMLANNISELKIIIEELQKGARILEQGGADFVLMPCNTAHKFAEEIQAAISIPFINMIEVTVQYIADVFPDTAKAGILGTDGTLQSYLYQKFLEEKNIKPVIPDNDIQKEYVMKAIYNIKRGKKDEKTKRLFLKAKRHLEDKAASAIIFGCTELPLIFDVNTPNSSIINPTKILADLAIEKCMNTPVLAVKG